MISLDVIKNLVGDKFDDVKDYFQGQLDKILYRIEGKVDDKFEELGHDIDRWKSELFGELIKQTESVVYEIKKVVRIGIGLVIFGAALIAIGFVIFGFAI